MATTILKVENATISCALDAIARQDPRVVRSVRRNVCMAVPMGTRTIFVFRRIGGRVRLEVWEYQKGKAVHVEEVYINDDHQDQARKLLERLP
jgi:hypothetical protein